MTDEDKSTLPFEIQDRDQPRKKKRHRPSAPCKLEGCNGWAWAQGYCDPHYQKLKREGHIKKQRVMKDDIARFHTKYKVNPATGCWEWTGNIHPNGYGMIGITENGKGRSYRAHRFAYDKLVGPIPDGLVILHKCDVRHCVCPDHLVPGTDEDNMRDCVDKRRNAAAKGTAGSKLTAAMVVNIRLMYARGLAASFGNKLNHYCIQNLAAVYGVEHATIWGIVKGRSHLGG